MNTVTCYGLSPRIISVCRFKENLVLAAYNKAMKRKPNIPRGLPVSVEAPIVVDAASDAGVKPLLDFIGGLESNSNEAVAEAEGKRLGPYFSALSVYLRQALGALGGTDESVQNNRDKLEKLTTPESLSGLFTAAARRTRNTITSDVAVLTSDIIKTGPASYLFGDPQFQVHYNYAGHMFNFGFIQVYEGGDRKKAKSSTAFPTFILDKDMMANVAPHRPLEMLKNFQNVIAWVNHDMLHHFTSPLINPIVTKRFAFDDVIKPEGKDGPVHLWYKTLPGGYGSYYEPWALVSHEKIMLTKGNEAQVSDITKQVDSYFSELTRIGADIARDKGPEKAHETVDYFGMVMAHALSRVFPLNHPVMEHCLQRMEKADPTPEKYVEDARKMVPAIKPPRLQAFRDYFANLVGKKRPSPEPEGPLTAIRNFADKGYLKRIADAYKTSGLDILPADDAQVSYGNLKLLQLIGFTLEDVRPHVPTAPDKGMGEMRDRADRAMVGMISAASQSFDYKPK